MTVKELRQLVKDQSDGERGLLSRLKRKQDLVEYLEGRQLEQQLQPLPSRPETATETDGDEPGSADNDNESRAKRNGQQRQKMPTRMPPLVQHEKSFDSKSPSSSGYASPKDAIYEKVYRRYPTLRTQGLEQQQPKSNVGDEEDDESTVAAANEANVDVRQLYHPMLVDITSSKSSSSNSNTTSSSSGSAMSWKAGGDMDLVFVGTASCTPGTTRGVSCTALRLNGRQRQPKFAASTASGSGIDGSGDGTASNVAQGGTWLFDVGECTQVSV